MTNVTSLCLSPHYLLYITSPATYRNCTECLSCAMHHSVEVPLLLACPCSMGLKPQRSPIRLSTVHTPLQHSHALCLAVEVACGAQHTLALTRGGEVLSWGRNLHGQCGRPHQEAAVVEQPQPVALLPPYLRVVDVAAGMAHSAAVTGTGRQGVRGVRARDCRLHIVPTTPLHKPWST